MKGFYIMLKGYIQDEEDSSIILLGQYLISHQFYRAI
jgi:hypothetical protein